MADGPFCFIQSPFSRAVWNLDIVLPLATRQLQETGSSTVEEVLLRLLETQEEQDRWLSENREAINAKIRRGIEQLDGGEGIPEDQLDSYLDRLKAKAE